VTFYRNLPSAFTRAQLREWHAHGHGIGSELNLNEITYHKSMAELADADPAIRQRIQVFVDDFDREFGLPASSVCIHSCQWTGARMVRLLQERGWQMGTHFCGHDPRLNRHNYGLYCISSTLPMRYYDPEAGVMDFFLQPTQGDESQSVGWISPERRAAEPQVRRTGFTVAEYARVVIDALAAAQTRYHSVFVGNWHPVYLMPELLETEKAGFYTRDAFTDVMTFLAESGARCWQLEEWTRFTAARNNVTIELTEWSAAGFTARLRSPQSLSDLTILLHGLAGACTVTADGRPLPVDDVRLEGRTTPSVTIDLAAGQTICLAATAT
jgi:hypothetical protein